MARQPRHAADRPSSGRAVLAALCSLILPGTGHLLAGRRRGSIGYLAFSAASVLAVIGLALAGRTTLVEIFVQQGWIITILVGIVISAVIRVIAAYDSYRLIAPIRSSRPSRTAAGLAAVSTLAAAVVIPHVVVGRAVWAHELVVSTVFQTAIPEPVVPDGALPSTVPSTPPTPVSSAEESSAVATQSTGATMSASPADEAQAGEAPAGTTTRRPTSRAASATASDAGTPSVPTSAKATTTEAATVPASIWGGDDRYTVLLLGSDAGPGRVGARTDTMMLLSISRADRSAVLIGIPRNLQHAPFVAGPMRDRFPHGFNDLENAIYSYGVAHPGLFPGVVDPGVTALEQSIAQVTGLEIDNWAMVDLGGIVAVTKALGGVTMTIPRALSDRVSPYRPGGPWIEANIPKGTQHLTPDQVYVYVRSRSADSDYQRMGRQRCVMAAIGKTLTGPTLVTAYPKLADAIIANVSTDIPQAWLPDLVTLGAGIDMSRVRTLLLVPPLISTADPDFAQIRGLVAKALDTPATGKDATASSLVGTCG